jgi:hypothetical protein
MADVFRAKLDKQFITVLIEYLNGLCNLDSCVELNGDNAILTGDITLYRIATMLSQKRSQRAIAAAVLCVKLSN